MQAVFFKGNSQLALKNSLLYILKISTVASYMHLYSVYLGMQLPTVSSTCLFFTISPLTFPFGRTYLVFVFFSFPIIFYVALGIWINFHRAHHKLCVCQCISLSLSLFLPLSFSSQIPWENHSATFIVRLCLGICLMNLGTARRHCAQTPLVLTDVNVKHFPSIFPFSNWTFIKKSWKYAAFFLQLLLVSEELCPISHRPADLFDLATMDRGAFIKCYKLNLFCGGALFMFS